MRRGRVKALITHFLANALVFGAAIGTFNSGSPARAQSRAIVVSAEHPNVWTLEQAHYLLAQMRRRNLDLRAKRLQDLDPNEINGLRFEIFKQLIEFGATFNQADRLSNEIVARNKEANSERRLSLTARRDKLREESLELTRQISQLQSEKARATSDDERDRIDADIAAKTALRDKVDKEIEFSDNELKTLGDSSGELKPTTGEATFDPQKLPQGQLEKAFADAATQQINKFNETPQLNALLRLENFLQMQYEIIAKQLTLLRDEVGPGERLLFLELPQTVNVTHHEANKKWAQSWWRIAGYTRNIKEYADELPEKLRQDYLKQNPRINPTSDQGAQRPSSDSDRAQPSQISSDRAKRRAEKNIPPDPTSMKIEELLKAFRTLKTDVAGLKREVSITDEIQYVNLQSEEITTVPSWDGERSRLIQLNDRTVRTVELIPRQSSLNVNDMKLHTRAGAFNFVLSTLFGFGSRLNIQRQREQFSQFVQQELYSAAFGKGSREFGWTFTPMPGTDRIMSGVRTTYAVVVVPDEATSLVLEANGCYFPRTSYQPNDFNDTINDRWNDAGRTSRNCSTSKAFLISIPVGGSGRNDFFVEGLYYRPVAKGERIVVSVYGYNFSDLTGVLVNGSPLTHAIGLAQPLILDDSTAGTTAAKEYKDEKFKGRIERVDSNQLVFSFEPPLNFSGTPDIVLIAPGKAINLKQLNNLHINGLVNTSLTDSIPMFDARPTFRIDNVELFLTGTGERLTAVVSGAGFRNAAGTPAVGQVLVNGQVVRLADYSIESSNLIRIEFVAPLDNRIRIVLISNNPNPDLVKTISSEPVPKPKV